MFWGCMSGHYGKGTGMFWEKKWRTITKESYCAHTVPIVLSYMLQHPGLQFQQDGGPGHNAEYSLFWPPFSPDLSYTRDVTDSTVQKAV